MNFDSLSYELGVMMFNVANETNTSGFDLQGNFDSMAALVGRSIVKEKLRARFMAESQNHRVLDHQRVQELFDTTFSQHWSN